MGGLIQAALTFLDELFWRSQIGPPFLLYCFGIACLLGQHRTLLQKDLWLHRSSRFDLKMLIVSSLFITSFFYWLRPLLNPIIVARGTLEFTLPWKVAVAFLTLFVADFIQYWVHRWQHQNPTLWRLHRVHHSAEVLTPLTVARTHPLDLVNLHDIFYPFLSSWVLTRFFDNVTPLQIGGIAASSLFVRFVLLSPLNHSPVSLDFGIFGKVFVAPAYHQIHHSRDPAHVNKNYANVFSFWDWVFGTAALPQRGQKLEFGLAGEDSAPSVAQALFGDPRY